MPDAYKLLHFQNQICFMEIKKDGDLLKQIGRNLLQLRTAATLKQEQVAHDLGIRQETLSKYENGGTDITICTLAEFAKYFKVDISAIINIQPNQVFNVHGSNSANGIIHNQHNILNEGYRLYIEQLKNENTFLKEQLTATR